MGSARAAQHPEVDRLVQAAAAAHASIAGLDQAQVDAVVDALHRACMPNLERWAEMAVQETGFGNVKDKTEKNRFCAEDLYKYIRPLRTAGVLSADPERGVYEIAWPYGVVAAVLPSTNPTSTAIYKIMIALKARCAIVLSPHPNAKGCIGAVCDALREAVVACGLPGGLVGCIADPTIEATQALMAHRQVDVILSTGGPGIVRAAYSSGKPAFGVGPGNVPVYVDRSAEIGKAAKDILAGKTFDFGTICASEQAIVADAPIAADLRAALKAEGAYFLDEADKQKLANVLVTDQGTMNAKCVGKPPAVLAELAGLKIPPHTRCLVVELTGVGRDEPLSMEKLTCVLGFYSVRDWEEGCARCISVLRYGGMGHTLGIHCTDMKVIGAFAFQKPAFRIVVNSPTTHGAIGHTTGVAPSMTLGCGTAGNNITSDNITPLHLVHRKRIAFEIRPVTQPLSKPLPPLAEDPAEKEIERLIVDYVNKRGLPAGAAPRAPGGEDEKPWPFVCEDDVRRAMAEGRKIPICPKTILTPSARDYGDTHKVFRRS